MRRFENAVIIIIIVLQISTSVCTTIGLQFPCFKAQAGRIAKANNYDNSSEMIINTDQIPFTEA